MASASSSRGAVIYLKDVVDIKSDENAELIPRLVLDNIIRMILVSWQFVVGCVMMIASFTLSSSMNLVKLPCTVVPEEVILPMPIFISIDDEDDAEDDDDEEDEDEDEEADPSSTSSLSLFFFFFSLSPLNTSLDDTAFIARIFSSRKYCLLLMKDHRGLDRPKSHYKYPPIFSFSFSCAASYFVFKYLLNPT